MKLRKSKRRCPRWTLEKVEISFVAWLLRAGWTLGDAQAKWKELQP